MIRSAHVDTFARDNLPAREQWPEFLFKLPELNYPDRLNCVSAFVDDWVTAGEGARDCLISPTARWSYADLAEQVNRVANVLTRDLGVVPGNRVLLRGPNSPMMVAAYFAVIKAGAVVVATMPLLRAKEIAFPLTKAEIRLALCDIRLADEMEKARPLAPGLERIVYWGSGAADSLEAMMKKDGYERFAACDTASDDVCLIAFTSGTTGVPKGTMHFHRDMLAICDTFGKYVLRAGRDDRFIGSPPIAFTFGLGGLVLFPLRVGAATILLERASRGRSSAGHRQSARDHLFHGADRLSRHAPQARGLRSFLAAQVRLRRRDLAGRDLRGVGGGDRHPHHRRARLDGDAAHLHRQPRGRHAPGRDRQAGSGLRGAGDRRGGTGGADRHAGSVGCPRSDRLPLSGRQASERICAERLERHRRHLYQGCRWLLPLSGPFRRHDHFRRLQHCRAGSGNGPVDPSGGSRMRRGRRSRTTSAARSSKPTWSSIRVSHPMRP